MKEHYGNEKHHHLLSSRLEYNCSFPERDQHYLHLEYRKQCYISVPELAVVTLYTAILGPVTLKKNGIEYLYASLNKHLHARSMVTP